MKASFGKKISECNGANNGIWDIINNDAHEIKYK